MKMAGRSGIVKPIILFGLVAMAGCKDDNVQATSPDIAVTNSYLECVVRDLCGNGVDVLSLSPPGMCPGHFDISPAQVRQLRGCRILLLFEFQQPLEQRVARLKDNGLKTCLIRTPPALCVPQTYLTACQQVSAALSVEYPEKAAQFTQRLPAIRERLEALTAELRSTVLESGAASAEILVSNHQARFADWLGLETVATFVGSDIETVSNIDHCLKKAADREVRFVIANRQEGTALAQALADRLQAKAVVFSNFPPVPEVVAGFDRLLRDNVGVLLEAVTR